MVSMINIAAFFYPVVKTICGIEVVEYSLAFIINTVDISTCINKNFCTLYIIALLVEARLALIILVLNMNA
ncbi:hypothetical protein PGS1_23345 [Enterobacter cloacae subsp. cloacae GS1]|nr:hypothetical protein PGS1_23345 [Enterobacter cloacae subsp. cloacae GS1]